jgi:hypothetical protein
MQQQIAAAGSIFRPEVSHGPSPARTRASSWTNVTSNKEFVFAPTTSMTPSTHTDHVTSPAVFKTSELAVYASEVVDASDEPTQRTRRADAVERSWESRLDPANPRSAFRVSPRAASNQSSAPYTSGPSRAVLSRNVRRNSNSKSEAADLDTDDIVDDVINTNVTSSVGRDRLRPILVPVTVQHETTIPVKTTTVSADRLVKGKSLTSLLNGDVQLGPTARSADDISNIPHVSSLPSMADQNGFSVVRSGCDDVDGSVGRGRLVPITIVNGNHSSNGHGSNRRPELLTSNVTPINDADDETFELNIVKSGLGLSFCIEGGMGSANGDQPITVKRVFRGRPSIELRCSYI